MVDRPPSFDLGHRLARRIQTLPARLEKALYGSGVLSPKRLTLPDFLGIGFMKCGTTWLYENLRVHPEIFMSDAKELRYFLDENFQASLRSYASNFAGAKGRVRGEFSPSYAWLPSRRIAFIRRIMPDLRLLVMLRDPVAREWSRVTHLSERAGVHVAQATDADIMSLIDGGHALLQGGYGAILDRWSTWFPAERMFIGLYEDIGARPEDLLSRVFRHLGASTDVDWERFPARKVIVPPAGDRYASLDQGRGVIADNYRPSRTYFPDRYRDHLTEIFESELREMHARFGDDILVWESAARVLGRAPQASVMPESAAGTPNGS